MKLTKSQLKQMVEEGMTNEGFLGRLFGSKAPVEPSAEEKPEPSVEPPDVGWKELGTDHYVWSGIGTYGFIGSRRQSLYPEGLDATIIRHSAEDEYRLIFETPAAESPSGKIIIADGLISRDLAVVKNLVGDMLKSNKPSVGLPQDIKDLWTKLYSADISEDYKMKLTKSQLKQIIEEELEAIFDEAKRKD